MPQEILQLLLSRRKIPRILLYIKKALKVFHGWEQFIISTDYNLVLICLKKHKPRQTQELHVARTANLLLCVFSTCQFSKCDMPQA